MCRDRANILSTFMAGGKPNRMVKQWGKQDKNDRRGQFFGVVAVNAIAFVLALVSFGPAARGHEVVPSVADMTLVDGALAFDVQFRKDGLFQQRDTGLP